MQPSDIAAYAVPSDPRMHPDGARVAFVVTRADIDEDRYDRRIWWWDAARGARAVTAGPADTSPRWSPDGSKLAFLRGSTEPGVAAQVAMMDADGGEASILTDLPLGVRQLEWSPDGRHLAVVGVDWTEEWRDLDDEERSRRPRRITRVPYRGDGAGWTHDRRAHVYLVDVADGTARCLTPGEFNEGGIAWKPDGSAVAFISARHAERGLDPGQAVYEVDVATGDDRELTGVGTWSWVGYAPDGTPMVLGRDDPWTFPSVPILWRLDPDGPVALTEDLDRNILPYSPAISPAGPQWLGDGTALVTVEDQGRVWVGALQPDGAVTPVIHEDAVITGISPRPDGAAAFTMTRPTDPGELWWWEDGVMRALTNLNAEFRSSVPLAEPQRFTIEHEGVTVEGWVYLPPGDGSVPTLFNIHGGPATQYGYGFFDEFQVYVGAGYGVVATNPRGSSGYGNEFMRAAVGVWHEESPPDLRDQLAAPDAAAARHPRLDLDRLGVMGGSYGGLSTARLVAVDHRYGSAVAERGLYSWVSFAGTSDIGPWFTRAYLGAGVADGADRVWAASPLARAHHITTPTLIIHSEADYRTPIEQGEQLFALLLEAGVPVEFLRFPPPEGHEMSRGGKPKHRVERFDAILDWHRRHLSPGAGG